MQLRRQRTSTIPTRFYQPFLVLFSVDDPGITLQPDELAEELPGAGMIDARADEWPTDKRRRAWRALSTAIRRLEHSEGEQG
jgi:hypothetical protein